MDTYKILVAWKSGALTINQVSKILNKDVEDLIKMCTEAINYGKSIESGTSDSFDLIERRTLALAKLKLIHHIYTETKCKQVIIRNKFPGTVGQKGWLLCRLDYLWSKKNKDELFSWEKKLRPNINIIKRCFLSPFSKNYIDFANLNDVSTLSLFVARSHPKGKIHLEPLTFDDLKDYFKE